MSDSGITPQFLPSSPAGSERTSTTRITKPGSLRSDTNSTQLIQGPASPGNLSSVEADFVLLSEASDDAQNWNRATVSDLNPVTGRPAPVIPGYSIDGELGRGSTGVVYLARQLQLNRLCALKLILAGAHAEPESAIRFLHEAEAVAKLVHPNIVHINGIGEVDGLPYLDLELLEGGSLDRKLDGRPWDPRDAARLVEAATQGIRHPHGKGVAHRDLKPANLLLTPQGVPKIADFGLAKALNTQVNLTRTEVIMGSPSYMAPEQARGNTRDAGAPADIYALGAIFYELLSGRPPFQGDSVLETLEQVKSAEPVPPSRLVAGLPPDADTIALKCLEKEPDRRYLSAADLADDLDRFIKGVPIRARRVTARERCWRWCRRNPTISSLAAGLAAALLLLALAAAIFSIVFWHQRDVARASLARARKAEFSRQELLREAYLAQATAGRYSGLAGHRAESLSALSRAGRIRAGSDLRDEAIACLVIPDLTSSGRDLPLPTPESGIGYDSAFQRYAVSHPEGGLEIRRFANDEVLSRLEPAGGVASLIEFQPGGPLLAASYHMGDNQYLIKIWNTQTTQSIWEIPTGEAGARLAFSPDGNWLAAVRHEPESVALYEAATGRLTRLIEEGGGPRDVAFSPDSRSLAVTLARPARVRIHDLNGQTILWDRKEPQPPYGLAWHPDGRLLAVAGGDHRIRILDVLDRHLQTEMVGHQAEVISVAFSHDGEFLASQSNDRTIRLWDPWSGRQLLELSVDQACCMRFSADDRLLSGARIGSAIRLWSMNPGAGLRSLRGYEGQNKGPWKTAFDPRGRFLAVAEADGVRLWHARLGRLLGFLPTGACTDLLFTPDGSSLVTSHHSSVLLWPMNRDTSADSVRVTFGPPRELHRQASQTRQSRLALSRDGRLLAIADPTSEIITLLDPSRPTDRRELGPCAGLASLAMSPDGTWIAAASRTDQAVHVWDQRSGSQVALLTSDTDAEVSFSPDGKLIAIGSHAGYRLLKTATWKLVRSISRSRDGRGLMAFSPDGRYLAVTSTSRILQIVNTSTGSLLATLTPRQPLLITSMAFEPNGGFLAVSTENHAAHLWDLDRLASELDRLNLDPGLRKVGTSQTHHSTVEIQVDYNAGLALPELGAFFAREGRWVEAAQAIALVADRYPHNLDFWFGNLLGRLEVGDQDGYRRYASTMRDRLSRETDPTVVNDLVWGFVLGSQAVDDYSTLLARMSGLLKQDPSRYLWLNTQGALLYRAGRAGDSIRWLERSMDTHQEAGTPFDWLFLAMAHHDLGNPSQARMYLSHSIRWMEEADYVDPHFEGPLGWEIRWQWLLLLREAQRRMSQPVPELPLEPFAPE